MLEVNPEYPQLLVVAYELVLRIKVLFSLTGTEALLPSDSPLAHAAIVCKGARYVRVGCNSTSCIMSDFAVLFR